MADIVISGNTSGAVTLRAPDVSGTTLLTLPTTSGTIVTTAGATSLTTSGNLTFTGTGNRILGDFTNATGASRVFFQTSTTNGNTNVGLMPNGTGNISLIQCYANSDLTNSSYLDLRCDSINDARLRSDRTGSGTYLPLTMYTGGSERLRIDTSGNVGVNTSNPGAFAKFVVLQTSDSNAFQIATTTNGAGMYWIPTNSFGVQQYSYGGLLAIGTADSNLLSLRTNSTERMRITSDGLLQFNSGYGSVATAYGCRAWVTYNGSSAAVIASGGVSSVTKNGTGDWTVNFSITFPDANYAVAGFVKPTSGQSDYSRSRTVQGRHDTAPTTTQCRVSTVTSAAGQEDNDNTRIMFVR